MSLKFVALAVIAALTVTAQVTVAHADPSAPVVKSSAVVVLRAALTTNAKKLANAPSIESELAEKCTAALKNGMGTKPTLNQITTDEGTQKSDIVCEKIGSINACSAVCTAVVDVID